MTADSPKATPSAGPQAAPKVSRMSAEALYEKLAESGSGAHNVNKLRAIVDANPDASLDECLRIMAATHGAMQGTYLKAKAMYEGTYQPPEPRKGRAVRGRALVR